MTARVLEDHHEDLAHPVHPWPDHRLPIRPLLLRRSAPRCRLPDRRRGPPRSAPLRYRYPALLADAVGERGGRPAAPLDCTTNPRPTTTPSNLGVVVVFRHCRRQEARDLGRPPPVPPSRRPAVR